MAPKTFRAGGKNTDICFAVGQCSLGAILVAQSDKGVCAILMGDDPRASRARSRRAVSPCQSDRRQAGLRKARRPGRGARQKPEARCGTAARHPRHGVSTEGLAGADAHPPGRTVSYAEIAERIGQPKSVRAVAGACAANAIAVAIPCHRVVRSDGALSGYRWGIARKRALLLERERK